VETGAATLSHQLQPAHQSSPGLPTRQAVPLGLLFFSFSTFPGTQNKKIEKKLGKKSFFFAQLISWFLLLYPVKRQVC
jgi:hypothetical protein